MSKIQPFPIRDRSGFDYIVGFYHNETGKRVDHFNFYRTTKNCGDEVLEYATASPMCGKYCTPRIEAIGILNEIGQLIGFVDGEVA